MKQPNNTAHFNCLTVILSSKEKQQHLLNEWKENLVLDDTPSYTIIQKNWPIFPYLKLKDHVYLDISSKEIKSTGPTYQSQLKLDSSWEKLSADELSLLEKIKLQLLHALLSKRTQIIVEDAFDDLTITETQELLDILCLLARQENQTILLFTNNATIAHSPYIDHLEDAS
ncbi:hypothetical protein [Enterococcus sp. DIV0660C]|uniref:hypothetical protein n=1 Tax=Enterococcus sp. DIV0660C TaxID=2230880 RepID=UPI001A8F70FC|nr:hypothetical protein [Enterococcus sp. DIV0660C]MBO0432042.1 hypothetical protein [Enterococcus sp. DIV0660C]